LRAVFGTWQKPARTVTLALLALAALGWLYIWRVPMPMPGRLGVTNATYLGVSFLMWLFMMIAMMVPAVLPVVLLFHRTGARNERLTAERTTAFLIGYLTAWAAFSAAATAMQCVLIFNGIIDPMTVSRVPAWSAMLLIGAGLYQWLPLKTRCLDHCRDPSSFLMHHYRPGTVGAWRTGVDHGWYCLGCCALLMMLLFVFGSMNLALIAALTVLITLEKLAPLGHRLRRATGATLIAMAAYVLWRSA
jgi:predicted metal-binding membrane protein